MYVEEDNPSKEILKDLLQRYSQGDFLNVVDDVKSILHTYDKSVFLWNLLGATYLGLNKFADAAIAFSKTVELKPDFAEGLGNYGLALHKQHKYKEAVEYYNQALALMPELAETHNNLGHIYRAQNKHSQAISCYENALKYDVNLTEAAIYKMQQQAHICDWGFYNTYETVTSAFIETGFAIEPFSFISKEDNPKRQRQMAETCARLKYKRRKLDDFIKPEERPEKIKIGYFSSDLHDHPVTHLMSGVFDHHDRKRFEIYAFYFGNVETDHMMVRVQNSVDEFINIKDLNELDAAKLARSKNIDIAIDMTGYTGSSRTGIFSYGVAPIQVNYLGYPSTMGAEFIDYIIADKNVIPEENQQFYTENIIYMPHSFMPNDDNRRISTTEMKRSDHNLPDDAFVFCSFNNIYKITVREFDIWMKLLHRVEGSVLWLSRANSEAKENLIKEAVARGINAERLIFAERVPEIADHLARQRLADLFVDSFNYNAHTTACDALWAGLPLVTLAGKQFASRVAGSVLTTIGAPELITQTEENYEALIVELAENPQKLKALRQKIEANRATTPLFDTERYTRNMENAFEQAYQKYLVGEAPSTIEVVG